MIDRFGMSCNLQLDEIRNKVKNNCLEKYGVEHNFLRSDVIDKRNKSLSSESCKQKHRESWSNKTKDEKKIIGNKISKSVKQAFNDGLIEEKIKKTKLERYGDENYNNREKYIKTILNRTQEEKDKTLFKTKQTKLELYGNENYVNKEKIKQSLNNRTQEEKELSKERKKQTCLEKYGVEHPMQNINMQINVQNQYFLKNKRYSPSQIHICDNSFEIINDKNKFKDFLESIPYENRITNVIGKSLGISLSHVNFLIRKYDFYNLINYYTSHYEKDIVNFLENLSVFPSIRNRTIIYPNEIDMFIPDYNFGIEFNGNYWHSNIYKDKRYHQNKSLKAQEKGIFIYHIFEYEWNDERKRSIIESQLKNLCHKNENKIYARKCEIKEIKDNNMIRDFLNVNHLQGYRRSKIKIGLFYENELVSLITFGKPYLNKSNSYEWELYRFCNKLNTSVIGGFDKLFKYFIKTYNPQSILTYSDFSKGDGHTYEKLGFKKLKLTIPNYVWWKEDELLSRYQTQMKNEIEIMKELGYQQIFDCGNYKWEWTNKK